jgi:phosphohistidine swiveling domain-containing protein
MAERIWVVDNDPSERYPIYTRGNVGEVFPDTVAPLSWTMFGRPGAEPGWRDAFVRFGAFDLDEFNPDELEILGVFGGYCYLNVSISRIFGVRVPGLTPELVDQSIWGEMPGVPPYRPTPTDESPEHTERIQQTVGWIFTTPDLPELRTDQERVEAIRAARPDLSTLSNEELLSYMRSFLDTFRELFSQHLFTSYCAITVLGTISAICDQALGDPSLAMRLVGGVGDVDSAAPSFDMWKLGRMAADSAALTKIFEGGVDAGTLGELRNEPAAADFVASFDRFLDDYGSRGPNEWEIRCPTWGTTPMLALLLIDRMRVSDASGDPSMSQERLEADREALTAEVLAKLEAAPEAHGQMAAAVGAAKLFLPGRERTKTTIIKITQEVRLAALELGRRMVDLGVFETPENVGMLRNDELDDLIADPEAWRATVVERESLYDKLQTKEPPFIIDGVVPPLDQWESRDRAAQHVEPGTTLTGLPGCPGEASGRARVILSPFDAADLEPGDVLVAPITDPSWTPLFVPAAAVVVDVGAPLSHAIIVSRELGIPCVVSVTDATRKIPDGAMVEVNGTNGTVTVR